MNKKMEQIEAELGRIWLESYKLRTDASMDAAYCAARTKRLQEQAYKLYCEYIGLSQQAEDDAALSEEIWMLYEELQDIAADATYINEDTMDYESTMKEKAVFRQLDILEMRQSYGTKGEMKL